MDELIFHAWCHQCDYSERFKLMDEASVSAEQHAKDKNHWTTVSLDEVNYRG